MKTSFVLAILVGLASPSFCIEVTGTVRSADNAPVGGVNVLLKGTPIGTATDMNGQFFLDLPEGPGVLLFMFKGKKTLEQDLVVNSGMQYQVRVTFMNKTQTFNRSSAVIAAIPANSPVVTGRVVDQDGAPLYGVRVSQENGGFTSYTDMFGDFRMGAREGTSVITFGHTAFKALRYEVSPGKGDTLHLKVTLVMDTHLHRGRESNATSANTRGTSPR